MDQETLLRVLIWIASVNGRIIEKYGDPLPHGIDLDKLIWSRDQSKEN